MNHIENECENNPVVIYIDIYIYLYHLGQHSLLIEDCFLHRHVFDI